MSQYDTPVFVELGILGNGNLESYMKGGILNSTKFRGGLWKLLIQVVGGMDPDISCNIEMQECDLPTESERHFLVQVERDP